MQTSLLQTYNEVWSTGCLPEAWRTALVVPVLKVGKPPADLLLVPRTTAPKGSSHQERTAGHHQGQLLPGTG
ncbi:hypothetical protein V5799_032198 [Amblyomma americanum]|uniref:Uncharacterized protein n=1 Tax=Amblyomma americanum TaxID=6943 RepID=A0AAQ4DRV3_AMBAM